LQDAKSLFDLVVPEKNLNANFARIRLSKQSIAARAMLDDVFQSFRDPDGNFLEQFQTTGFDTRFFELYVFAYFSRSGFTIDRSHTSPDFIVERLGVKAAVEATTVNPSTSGAVAVHGKKIRDLNEADVVEYLRNELPIRFGSALQSKLQKRYWEQPHCAGLPFVVAIEAFHDEGSLHFSDTALMQFAYGIQQTADWGPQGELLISTKGMEDHKIGVKTVPSGLFNQPDAENLSAILFTNSGTHAKFSRMGYQSGFGNNVLKIKRFGRAFDPAPDSMDSILFSYDMDDPPLVEPWGQGLVVIENPRARHPLPVGFFVDAKEHHLEHGMVLTRPGGWHPFNSTTLLMHCGEAKTVKNFKPILGNGPRAVSSITKNEFWSYEPSIDVAGDQDGWFSDEFQSFLGLLVKSNGTWTALVLARDYHFKFFPIARKAGLSPRTVAVDELQHEIMNLLNSPRRLFSEPVS